MHIAHPSLDTYPLGKHQSQVVFSGAEKFFKGVLVFADIWTLTQHSEIHKKSIEWAYEYCHVLGSKVWVDFCSQTMRKALNHGLSGPWLIKI